MGKPRKPLVAGSFYEGTKEKLIVQIEECFKKGNGFPKPYRNGTVQAAIIPHAGYFFSGKAAAEAIKEIAETDVDTFIILGVNHSGLGGNTTTKEDFKTPLGTAKIDQELYKLLIKECKLEDDKEPHSIEHSIEVILPMLQYTLKKFTFVPIIVSRDADKLGVNIRKAVTKFEKKKKKNVCIIASGDMTHFGACYRYMPFSENIKENLYSLDKKAIDFILKKDVKKFNEYIKETHTTICGANTITALLHFLGKEKVEGYLLDYYTSADIMGDYRTAVGYAAIVFK